MSGRRRRPCPVHDFDYTAPDWPACRVCGERKYRRTPEVGQPSGYADLPTRADAAPGPGFLWWPGRKHPRSLNVDRALRQHLPEWEVGWRVAIYDDVTHLPNALIQASKETPCPLSVPSATSSRRSRAAR